MTNLGNLTKQELWIPLHTKDGQNATSIYAESGEVGLNESALIWESDSAPASGAPYCLIAEITSDDNAYPLVSVLQV